MDELEKRLRQGLQRTPARGFTPALRERIEQRTALTGSSDRLSPVSSIRRLRPLMPWLAAAAAILIAVAGVLTYERTVPVAVSKVKWSQAEFKQSVITLLTNYGWHPKFAQERTQVLNLPRSYVDAPGAYPVGLYWAYHDVLSKTIGLDLTPYLGTTVRVHIIPVQHWKTGVIALDQNVTTYAILVQSDKRVVGAWISQGLRGSQYAMSLSKRFFAQLTHQTWGQWLVAQGIANVKSQSYAQRASMTAPQVIRAYFQAINDHQDQLARSYMSEYSLYQELAMNLPEQEGELYNSGYSNRNDWISNVKSVHVTGIKLNNLPPYVGNSSDPVVKLENRIETNLFNRQDYGQDEYRVDVVETFHKVSTRNNGPGGWFVDVVRETPHGPWEFVGMGSGP